MGAQTFAERGVGKTAKEAFLAAREQALYDEGHNGYTGTIAEKSSFTLISKEAMTLAAAERLADELIEKGDARIDDKWGPAGCIPLDDGSFLFFGWASS